MGREDVLDRQEKSAQPEGKKQGAMEEEEQFGSVIQEIFP